jgi:hypothetical protein
MKLTIWQQFSSNHSASFTVVGKFESVEKAEKTAQIVWKMIQDIQDYYRSEYPDYESFWDFVHRNKLSRVEASIKQALGLDRWMMPLDWAYFAEMDNTVMLFENILFVDVTRDTWTGANPVDQLVESLGGEVAVSVESGDREAYFIISCEAPNVETAMQLEKSLIKKQFYIGNYKKTLLGIPNTTLDDFSLLECRDRSLSLERYAFDMKRHLPFINAYVCYLKDNGCINFKYSLREETNFNDSNPHKLP